MRVVKLPNVPNPDDAQYKGNILAYQRAMYKWATETKSKVEQGSLTNDTPMDQNFVLGSYALSTTMAGTSTGTDITNFVLSICAAMISKGIMKQQT